jgi:Fur family ferric uptake transcriptional regulator
MTNQSALLLKKARLKVTPTRKLIVNILSGECKLMNADHIYSKLRSRGVNQVTVYRTLAALEKAGTIKKVNLRRGSIFYELSQHHHHHLVCNNCGKVESFEDKQIENRIERILKTSKFKQVTDHSFEIFGLCKSCIAR